MVALAAALVLVIYLRQRRRAGRRYRLGLAAIRLALVALVLLMIAQVTLSLRRTGLPYAAVLAIGLITGLLAVFLLAAAARNYYSRSIQALAVDVDVPANLGPELTSALLGD